MPRAVYLDYNATAPVRPEAAAAVAEALAEPGNASSVHGFGRRARQRCEAARARVARLVGAAPVQVVFTGSGSESNNLVLRGTTRPRLLVSAGEHDSVLQAAEAETIPLRADGRIDLEALAVLLEGDARPVLVSVMLANNETGVIQPMDEVVALARVAGALVHCDAVQAAGKIPIDFAALGVDAMSLSAHKLGGPQGVGALVLAEGLEPAPLIRGGGQERRRRAGTENLPGIAGFGAAAEAALDSLPQARDLERLRDELERRISALAPELRIFGREAPRLPNTSCFALPGVGAETQVMALDLAGVAVSAGSACSSGKVQRSHVLLAMGADEALAGSAIRISLGWRSEPRDVEDFLAAWHALYRRWRRGGRRGGRIAGSAA
jgi:cysteine desulfurase